MTVARGQAQGSRGSQRILSGAVLVPTALTKHHGLGRLNKRHVFLKVLEAWKFKIRMAG